MIGTTLSHYRILDLLGAGGMGEVYRAEDTKLGREAALKILPRAFTADPVRLARFEREARALAAMNHPGIAAIYSFEAAEMSQEGMVLGTVGYMSPEQARGTPADRRSDIWAFGCVFFEMLTGKRVFGGETASDRLARILEREPEWKELPDRTPARLGTLIRRCLAKDPRKRLHDMADVRLELEEASEIEEAAPRALRTSPLWKRALPWVVATLATGIGLWALLQPSESAPPRLVTRFSLPGASLALWGIPTSPQVEISRDGSMLAFVVTEGSSDQLYLRRLESTEVTTLTGADMVAAPFFSPDGSWVGFQENREIKRVSVEGGKSWTVAETGYPLGATWGPDGTIVYGDELNFGLWRVPWDGGAPERLTSVDRDSGEYAHVAPQFLPGGREVLFTAVDDAGNSKEVAVVELETGVREDLFDHSGSLARYLGSGHIAYGSDGSLMVVPFDLDKRQVEGRPVAVFDGLLMGFVTGRYLANFAVADTGTLVYVLGPVIATGARLLRVDRAGSVKPLGEVSRRVMGPRFSPDGGRLAMMADVGSEGPQVWVRDLNRETFTRLTLEGENWWPLWSPDGSRIVFPSRQASGEVVNLAWIRADGTGSAELMTHTDLSEQPTTWTPDGRTLMAVPIASEPDFFPGRPVVLFEGDFVHSTWNGRNYDVAADGQSFVIVQQVLPENIDANLQVVLNWFTELERLAPAGSD